MSPQSAAEVVVVQAVRDRVLPQRQAATVAVAAAVHQLSLSSRNLVELRLGQLRIPQPAAEHREQTRATVRQEQQETRHGLGHQSMYMAAAVLVDRPAEQQQGHRRLLVSAQTWAVRAVLVRQPQTERSAATRTVAAAAAVAVAAHQQRQRRHRG
jgi:hypothetical protein